MIEIRYNNGSLCGGKTILDSIINAHFLLRGGSVFV